MRREKIATGEYYHILNRGFEKMAIIRDDFDAERFLTSMDEFNSEEPIGSIYENSFRKNKPFGNRASKPGKLVEFICYCLNPNHFHFLLRQAEERGIERFMHRLGCGYTKYFNQKYERVGYLFQGPYKAVHVANNAYLLHLSVYINLNWQVHKLGSRASKSSWGEYLGKKEDGGIDKVCNPGIILNQFKNGEEYRNFSEGTLPSILERKEIKKILVE